MSTRTVLQSAFAAAFLFSSGALFSGCAIDGESDSEPDDEDIIIGDSAFDQTDNACSGVRVPDRNGFQKRIALTFDDGPNLETTPKVLDILKARGIHATFLINGNRVTSDAHRQLLARMLAEGHIIGNHTHEHKNATELGTAQFTSQLERTDQILRDAGVQPRYFRFPFGASNCTTAQIVKDHGYIITGWHIDSADWCFAAGGGVCKKSTFKYVPDQYRSDMKALTLSQVHDTNGGIVLFHDIHPNTANNLAGIVDALSADGYTFTNVDDTHTFPKLNGQDAAAAPFIGTSCSNDQVCGFDNGYCLTANTQNGVCSMNCEGTCPDLDGHAPTFCAAVNPSQGACLPKSAPENGACSLLPGTEAVVLPRYIGTSSASAASATVCLPK